ncbi:MAG: hypothetical protein WC966_01880 [Bradymonadales bacterium]
MSEHDIKDGLEQKVNEDEAGREIEGVDIEDAGAEMSSDDIEVSVEQDELSAEAAQESDDVELEVDVSLDEEGLEAVAEEAEDAEPEKTVWDLAWEDRITGFMQEAENSSGAEALEWLVQAIRTADFHRPADIMMAELWGRALSMHGELARELFVAASRKVTSKAEAWEQVSRAHEIALQSADDAAQAAISEAWAWVDCLRSGALEAGKERLANFSDGRSAAIAEALEIVATGNWRKVEVALGEYLKGAGFEAEAYEAELAHWIVDCALSAGSQDRAAEILRRTSRKQPDNLDLKWQLALISRDQEKWNAYVDALSKDIVDSLDKKAEKVEVYEEMINVYSNYTKQDVMVVRTYAALLEVDPENDAALEELVEIYERMRRWPDLVKLLVGQAEAAKGQRQVNLYLRVANIYLEKLSRKVDAIGFFEQVLQIDPQHVESIEQLKVLYNERRDWEKLIDVHWKELSLMASESEQIELLKLMADIAKTKLRKNDAAIGIWVEVLERAPEDVEALNALEGLYESEKRWSELSNIYERKAALEESSDERFILWQKLGTLCSDRIGDNRAAISAWRKVLEIDPNFPKGIDNLRKLLIEERDWDALEEYYKEKEQDAELVKLLESLSRSFKEPVDIKAVLLRASTVYEDSLNDSDKAMSSLERILELDAQDADAALALLAHYERCKDYEKLAKMLEILHASSEEQEARSAYALRLAKLCESKLDDKERAYHWYHTAVKEDALFEPAYDGLERVGAAVTKAQAVVDLYTSHLEQVSDERVERELKFRSGRMLLEHLDRADEAQKIFEDILAQEPENIRALGALELILEKEGRFNELLAINEKRMALAKTPEDVAETLLSGARIHEQHLSDKLHAIENYERVCELLPEDMRAYTELHRLYAEQDAYEELARVLQSRLQLIGADTAFTEVRSEGEVDEEGLIGIVYGALLKREEDSVVWIERQVGDLDEELAVSLWSELGDVCRERLSEYDLAVRSYANILCTDLGNTHAKEALESMLEEGIRQGDVARSLSKVYASQEEFEPLAKMCALQADSASDARDKISYLLHGARIQREFLSDNESAYVNYERALSLNPASQILQAELKQMAEMSEDWTRVTEIFENVERDITEDDELSTQYNLFISSVWEEKLDDNEKAIQFARRALQKGSSQHDVLATLEDSFTRLDSWEDVIAVLKAKALLSEDDESLLSNQMQMASIRENFLNQNEEAIEIYLEILDKHPENIGAMHALDRLYAACEMWDEAAANCERKLELLSEEDDLVERETVRCQLASILSEKLGATDRAIDIFSDVLLQDPSNQLAISGLEVMLEKSEGITTEQVSEILLPIYDQQNAWEKRAWANEQLLRVVDDPFRRRDLLHEIAKLYETQGHDHEKAFDAYSRSLKEDLRSQDTIQNLFNYADVLDKWQELVGVMEAASEESDDAQAAKNIQCMAAEVYRERLDDLAGATASYERVRDNDPEDIEVLNALEGLYREQSAWEPLAKNLMSKAELSIDASERKNLLFQAAVLQEEVLEDVEAAIAIHREILADEAGEPTALDSLERLYTDQEQWSQLLEVLNAKIDNAQSDEERTALYHQVGALQEEKEQDKVGAIESYQQVLSIDPENEIALESLDRLYSDGEDWANLIDILERREAVSVADADKVVYRFRQAQCWHVNMDDLARAVEIYQSVLDLEPIHEDAIAALEKIISIGGDNAVQAAHVLEPIYKALERWKELVAVYEVLVENSDDVEDLIRLLGAIGTIEEDLLEDAPSAYNAWYRALCKDPAREELWNTVERLAESCGFWQKLVEQLNDLLLEISSDPSLGVIVASRMARIYEEELQNPEQAIAMLQRVLDFDPSELNAIKALDRLYEVQQQWTELAELLRVEIDLAQNDEERLACYYRLGAVHETCLENDEEAISCYNEMLMLSPGQPEAIESLLRMFTANKGSLAIADILEPFYRSTEDWEALISFDLQLVDRLEDENDRYDKLIEIADVYLQQLHAIEEAQQIYGRALVERPGDDLSLSKIDELSEVLQDWSSSVVYFKNAIEASDDDHVKQDLMLRKARAYDAKLEDFANAERCYIGVLNFDEENLESLQALDRIYTSTQRWSDLEPIIRRELVCVSSDDERIELMMRLGTVLSEMLDNKESAIETYQEVLSIDPSYMGALTALEHIHHGAQNWEALYEVFEQQSSVVDDTETRVTLWGQMAGLASEVLDRPNDAVDLWYQVLDAQGDSLYALQNLELLFVNAQRWADAADVIERQVPLCEDDVSKLETYKKLGRLWTEQLEDIERALDYWRNAHEVQAQDLETLRAIQAIDEELGDKEDLALTLRKILSTGQLQLDEQMQASIQMAQVLADDLGRTDEAIDTWLYVLQLEPTHLDALSELERLYESEQRWEDVVKTLNARCDVVGDVEEKIKLQRQIAEVWELNVGDVDRAAQAYMRILELDPARDEAFTVLEELYTNHEKWQELLGAYVERSEVVGEQKKRLELLLKASKVAEEKMENTEMAFVVLQSALDNNWSDPTLSKEIERLAEATASWPDIIAIYEGLIQATAVPTESFELHNRVARWYFHHLNNNEQSWYHFQFVLSQDPNNVNALASLTEIFKRLGNWEELVKNLLHRIELTTKTDERVDLFKELADVYETKYANHEQAIEAYEHAYKLDNQRVDVMKELARIFEQSQMWSKLVDILEKQCKVIDDPQEAITLRYQIAVTWENMLNDPQKAVESYQIIIDSDDTHANALLALERLMNMLQRWEELLKIYDLQLAAFVTGEEQIQIYAKMSQVYELHCDDMENAISSMRQILLIDPSNCPAIEQLERLYELTQQYNDLIEIINIHISVLTDANEHVELYRKLGETYRDKQKDEYSAVESFQSLLAIKPDDVPALYALADLYEASHDYISTIEILNRVIANLSHDPAQAIDVQYRIGQIYKQKMEDDVTAEERFRIALDVDPSYMNAIDALKEIYEEREDWTSAVLIIKQKIECTRELDDKAKLYCDLGDISFNKLDDPVNAYVYYEEALLMMPNYVRAALPLAEKCLVEKSWARSLLLFEIVIQNTALIESNEELYLYNYKAGYCCQQLAQDEKALEFFRNSYELNQNYPPTILGMGQQLMREKDYDRAYNMFQTALERFPEALSQEQIIQVYYDSAIIKKETADLNLSRQLLERILEANPDHSESLDLIIEVCEEAENWESLLYYRNIRIDRERDNAVKFVEIIKNADIIQAHLNNLPLLVETYHTALQIDPNSMLVLANLLRIYSEEKQWESAIQVTERICDIETNPETIARFQYTIAVIYRDELEDDDRALEYFNKTLDNNVNELKAFEAIDRILTAAKDWNKLETNYRKMIQRVRAADSPNLKDTEFQLWYALGETYRTRLEQWDNAVSSFKMASSLKPSDADIHEILADLYMRMPNREEDAIQELRTLLSLGGESLNREKQVKFYRGLFYLYYNTKQYDRAWCITNITTYKGFAKDDELEFNDRYLGDGLVIGDGRIVPETWELIRHPGQNLYISNIFAILQNHARDVFCVNLKRDWSMSKRDRFDFDNNILFWKVFSHMIDVINVSPTPTVYRAEGRSLGMINANLDTDSLIIGDDMVSGRSQRDLGYIIARQLTLIKPEHYMAGIRLPSENLRVMMLAVIAAFTPQQGKQQLDENSERIRTAIAKMPRLIRDELQKQVTPIMRGKFDINTSHWLKAVDYTANRVALLLCGDLATALRNIRNDVAPISKLTNAEREEDLITFAMSDAYFELRQRLGVAIE